LETRLPRLGSGSSAGCSTSATSRVAMNRPVRTITPVRVTSFTSTTPREVEMSTRRPALVAAISYWATPLPVALHAAILRSRTDSPAVASTPH